MRWAGTKEKIHYSEQAVLMSQNTDSFISVGEENACSFLFFPPERVCTNATPILNNTNLNNFK